MIEVEAEGYRLASDNLGLGRSVVADSSGSMTPTWREVQDREFADWTAERVVVDTAGRRVLDSERELLLRLDELRSSPAG